MQTDNPCTCEGPNMTPFIHVHLINLIYFLYIRVLIILQKVLLFICIWIYSWKTDRNVTSIPSSSTSMREYNAGWLDKWLVLTGSFHIIWTNLLKVHVSSTRSHIIAHRCPVPRSTRGQGWFKPGSQAADSKLPGVTQPPWLHHFRKSDSWFQTSSWHDPVNSVWPMNSGRPLTPRWAEPPWPLDDPHRAPVGHNVTPSTTHVQNDPYT